MEHFQSNRRPGVRRDRNADFGRRGSVQEGDDCPPVCVSGVARGFLLDDGMYTTLDVPGSTATFAEGINNLGQIVGDYLDGSGNRHGFLATPVPEPSTLLLLAVGGAVLFRP
jgi:probable HAF family extracellular repeat protein